MMAVSSRDAITTKNFQDRSHRENDYARSDKEHRRLHSPSPKRKHSKQRKHDHRSKSDKRSKRSRSPSTSSSAEDESFTSKLAVERERRKEQKRRQKEIMKATETVEQKRARRLAKKMNKQQKVKEERGWHEDCMGYSNADNPFGDTNLTETFIWRKKLDREGLGDAPRDLIEKRIQERLEMSKGELEKVKRLRLERERQREERDKEAEMIQRDNELKQFREWSKQETTFHLSQARLRSSIRINEGRAKPIDLLARYINSEEQDDLEVEMQEPYTYLNGLTTRDLEDLLEDIKVYQELERNEHDDYWRDLSIIAREELHKLRKLDPRSAEYVGTNRRDVINESVKKDIGSILKGKGYEQLALLETEILRKIKVAEEGVDVGYWEALLGHLKAHMAKARLRKLHQETLSQKLKQLRTQQSMEVKTEQPDDELPGPSTLPATGQARETADTEVTEMTWTEMNEAERCEAMQEDFVDGGYSPQYIQDAPTGCEIVDPIEDLKRLEFARARHSDVTNSQEAAMEAELRKGMRSDEAMFSVEIPLEEKSYLWSDKYRPRKPRYFNRVHTGFEWNKYNQTHYDLDNPPPKIVQGYKFNIFYPDLLDPTKAPEFAVYPCEDPDFAILRFKAGPPYEDIGFKVVNREWEVSHKKGYRCQFQNGIFQLWFHFKKYRYRR